MNTLSWKKLVLIVAPLLALLGYAAVTGQMTTPIPTTPSASAQSAKPDAGEFYALDVKLVHLGQPFDMRVVLRCGSQARQIFGEGRSARSIYAPYIFGLADGPHGILVLSPLVCNSDFTRFPAPADYQPVIFWAPDAKNLEFMIAYLHEKAFDGPSSKLKFVSATLKHATRQEYDEWRKAIWPKNIVPLADDDLSWNFNSNYFSGASQQRKRTAKATWFQSSDLRDYGPNLLCHSMVRLRAGPELSAFLRKNRPSDTNRFWALPNEVQSKWYAESGKASIVFGTNPENGMTQMEPVGVFEPSTGVARSSGQGTLVPRHKFLAPQVASFGLVHRVPVYTNTAYPAIAAAGAFPKHRDIIMGPLADAGTAYCYREVGEAIFARRQRQWQGKWEGDRIETLHLVRAFVDEALVGQFDQPRYGEGTAFAEADEFIWVRNTMHLQSEWARNQ